MERKQRLFEAVEQARTVLKKVAAELTPEEEAEVLSLLKDQSWILIPESDPSDYIDGLCDSLDFLFAEK